MLKVKVFKGITQVEKIDLPKPGEPQVIDHTPKILATAEEHLEEQFNEWSKKSIIPNWETDNVFKIIKEIAPDGHGGIMHILTIVYNG
jgi:hypothetical protein